VFKEMTTMNDDPIIVVRRPVATSLAPTWHLLQGQQGARDDTLVAAKSIDAFTVAAVAKLQQLP
jgi:hypothetical protein